MPCFVLLEQNLLPSKPSHQCQESSNHFLHDIYYLSALILMQGCPSPGCAAAGFTLNMFRRRTSQCSYIYVYICTDQLLYVRTHTQRPVRITNKPNLCISGLQREVFQKGTSADKQIKLHSAVGVSLTSEHCFERPHRVFPPLSQI